MKKNNFRANLDDFAAVLRSDLHQRARSENKKIINFYNNFVIKPDLTKLKLINLSIIQ